MLYHKLLVALFALPFVIAQDQSPSAGDAAPAETPAGDAAPAETPAADAAGSDAGAAPAATTSHSGGSVGGNTENTGHGFQNSSAGDWKIAEFKVPSTEVYCEC